MRENDLCCFSWRFSVFTAKLLGCSKHSIPGGLGKTNFASYGQELTAVIFTAIRRIGNKLFFVPRPQNHKHGSVSSLKLFCSWPSYCLPHLTPDIQHFELCRRSEGKEIFDTNITAVCLVLASLKKKIWGPFESLKEIFDKKFWTKGWVLWLW